MPVICARHEFCDVQHREQPQDPKQRSLRVRAYWHCPEVLGPPSRSQSTASAWRASVRLPRCFTDPTFLIDRIRREHSPPRCMH
jgi:hypothetical protein